MLPPPACRRRPACRHAGHSEPRFAGAHGSAGRSATAIKIGQTQAYSGPASACGATGRGLSAFFKRVKDQGGIAGRRISIISAAAVINPAGPERAVGIVLGGYLKEVSDPAWENDPGMNEWQTFMKEHMPGADLADANHPFSYGIGSTAMQMLKQCDGNFSHENILEQATNLQTLQLPTLLPGITVSTSPTNYHPIRQLQTQRWTGARWERFGNVIEGAGA